MALSVTKGFGVSVAALCLAVTLASCATDAPPPPPPPPPPAPAGPPVALIPEISDAASVYVDYVEQARKLSAAFADGASVQSELQAGASIEPNQLAKGAVASFGLKAVLTKP